MPSPFLLVVYFFKSIRDLSWFLRDHLNRREGTEMCPRTKFLNRRLMITMMRRNIYTRVVQQEEEVSFITIFFFREVIIRKRIDHFFFSRRSGALLWSMLFIKRWLTHVSFFNVDDLSWCVYLVFFFFLRALITAHCCRLSRFLPWLEWKYRRDNGVR